MQNKKITVAMSGGIDSAVAALLLKETGAQVSGATMKLCTGLLPCEQNRSDLDVADAKAVCDRLGIEHRVYDMSERFANTVVKDFIDTYVSGGTPNPCVICNKNIKFGLFLDEELYRGADFIATGHYAKIEHNNGRFLVKKSKDTKKDQTYMLWSLSQHQLSHTVLPLGNLTKAEIRELGEINQFSIARKSDSQDICFIPDGDYAAFIERRLGARFPEGNYIDENGNILGKHKGVIHYTIGQRKGLGISMGKHIFVIDKNPECNTVTLADEDKLFTNKVVLRDINLIPFDSLDGRMRVEAKIRYGQKQSSAFVEQTGEGELTLIFDEPQRAPARGQSAVIYDGDYLLGGGIIK